MMIGAIGSTGRLGLSSQLTALPVPDFQYNAIPGNYTVISNTVSQLNDLGGTQSRHLAQTLGSQQPIAGTVNNRPAIIFDGNNDVMTAGSTAGTIGVENVTFFLVGAFLSASGEDIPLGIGATTNTQRIRCLYRSSGSTQLGFGTWSNDTTNGPSADVGGASHVWEVAQFGQQVFQTRDGVNEATYPRTLPNAPLPVNVNGISIGSLQGGSVGNYYTNIAIHEVVGYYQFLDERTRARIRAQLLSGWSL